jgi:predicted neutral ceramidase superfamily lipid hydrolase
LSNECSTSMPQRSTGASDNHPEDDRDIRTVAFGLAAITQAINDRKAKYDQFRLVEGGIPLASDIVDAITRGLSHPVWTFIDHVRRYRTGRAIGVDSEMKRREMFAGITLAYCHAAEVSQREGTSKVANGITWEDHRFSEHQIKGWIRRNRPEAEKLSRDFLDEAARLSPRDSLADRVLAVGRSAIFHSSATVPAARHKSS